MESLTGRTPQGYFEPTWHHLSPAPQIESTDKMHHPIINTETEQPHQWLLCFTRRFLSVAITTLHQNLTPILLRVPVNLRYLINQTNFQHFTKGETVILGKKYSSANRLLVRSHSLHLLRLHSPKTILLGPSRSSYWCIPSSS